MSPIGLLSYGLAAAGFLVLTLLLAISWEGRAQGVRLVIACAITAGWAALLGWGNLPLPLLVAIESLRYAGWILVLAGIAAAIGISSRVLRLVEICAVGAVFVLPLAARVPQELPDRASLLAAIGIVYSLAGLVMLEQVYRNGRDELRYSLRYLALALGLVFAYDLFVFAQAQLFKSIESASWLARGFLALLTVPMIAIAARRNPSWSLNVFVSRQVVFYSATFVAVGLYLVAMALGSYLIVRLSGQWGRVAQLVFVAGAASVLITLLASADVRRRARVFISKHFYRNKYDYRIEWLRFIQTLSDVAEGPHAPAPPGDAAAGSTPYQRAIRAIAQIISSPGGVVYVRPEGGHEFSVCGTWPPGRRTPAGATVEETHDLVRFLERRQWLVDLQELRQTPDVYEHISLPAAIEQAGRARLVLPLFDDTRLLGLMVLDEPQAGFKPNYEDRDLLKTVGRHVATYLAQHEADRRLAEGRQFEAYHRLTAFVMHDLKNLAAQLSLIVANAAKHRRNPEFVDDAISTVANCTDRMQRLIEQLRARELGGSLRNVPLAQCLHRAAERCALREPRPRLDAPVDVCVEADPDRLTSVIEHLLRNAQDATPPQGTVVLELRAADGRARITIRDSGSGMSPEFVATRLFKPFDTTKGSKGMGIGAYQSREYVNALGGALTVSSVEGGGSTFEITLPIAAESPRDGSTAPTTEQVTFSHGER